MKTKYIFIAIGLLISSLCFGQQKLFDHFADMKGVSSVYISPAMFDMIGSLDIDDIDLKKLSKIESINIVSTEQANIAAEMRKAFKNLVTSSHEELMRIRSDGKNITFNIKKKGNMIEEMVMLVDEQEKYVVIQILGLFTLKEIQEFAETGKQ